MRAPAGPSCPICGRPAPPPGHDGGTPQTPGERGGAAGPFPFCSPTCKLVDLGRWLDGSYGLPDPEGDSSETALRPGDDE